jgi:uncharacterized protein (TIGR02678 family)
VIYADLAADSPSSAALLRAHRLLLERPILVRTRQPDEYAQVARQLDLLESWHRERTGWPIYHDVHGGIIRLLRRPSLAPIGIWEPWRSEVVLSSPRDYACLVYLLWYARSPFVLARGSVRQVLLSDLSASLAQRSAVEQAEGDGFDFTRRRTDYHSLRRALRALEDLGAVNVVDEADDGPNGVAEALIEFTPVVEALIVELDLRRVNQTVGDAAGEESPRILHDAGRTPAAQRVWRDLLLGPVLLHSDDPEAFAIVWSRAQSIEEEAQRVFGYNLELTPVYARFIRPAGATIDHAATLVFQQQRGLDHAGLLLCSALRAAVSRGSIAGSDAEGCVLVERAALLAVFEQVVADNRDAWGTSLSELRPQTLLARVCARLRTLGMLRGPSEDGDVVLLPTAAHYHAAYPRRRESASAEESAEEQLVLELGLDRERGAE